MVSVSQRFSKYDSLCYVNLSSVSARTNVAYIFRFGWLCYAVILLWMAEHCHPKINWSHLGHNFVRTVFLQNVSVKKNSVARSNADCCDNLNYVLNKRCNDFPPLLMRSMKDRTNVQRGKCWCYFYLNWTQNKITKRINEKRNSPVRCRNTKQKTTTHKS